MRLVSEAKMHTMIVNYFNIKIECSMLITYIATDSDGDIWGFTSKPFDDGGNWSVNVDGGAEWLGFVEFDNENYDETLVKC